jgi:hypothetical protein
LIQSTDHRGIATAFLPGVLPLSISYDM